jgi:hypothetical protein
MAEQWLQQQPTEFLDKAIHRFGVAKGCQLEGPLQIFLMTSTSSSQ